MNKRNLDGNETNSCNFLKRVKIAVEEPLKENVIRYYLMSSLEHLAAVKIAITLWSRSDIQDEIGKLYRERCISCKRCRRYNEYHSSLNEIGQEIKTRVQDRVLELSEFDIIRKILSDTVVPVGQEISDWIEYHDRHVFNHRSFDQNLAVSCLNCLVWTSRGVIDYKETAKTLLAEKRSSVDTFSHNLSRTYCLEGNAAIIWPNVLDKMSYDTLQPKYDSKTLVSLWSALLDSDLKGLIQEVGDYNAEHETDYSLNEYALLRCNKKHRNNQEAIKYMWDSLSDEEKSRQVLPVVKYGKTDLKCFFLSQMNEAQQHRVFKAESRNILLCLLDDWLWKDYFLPTMHHVWDIIPAVEFFRVVEDIVERRMTKHYKDIEEYNRYKAILKELWRSAPKHLKEFIFGYQNGSRGSGIFFELLWARNMDLFKLMLSDISNAQKKTMVFSSRRNYRKCYWLIINDQIDVVKALIANTLFDEKDRDTFKRKLVEGYGSDIVVHFMQNQKRGEVDQFLQLIFESDHDKREFRIKLTYSKICDDILESIVVRNNVGGFEELENFFKWCASGSTQKVSELKREMYKVYFTKIHCKLIEEDRYQLLEQFLSWCFPNDEREVESIKHCFNTYNEYIQIVQLVLNLVRKNNRLKSLKKFVRWSFTGNREITKFKKWILEPGREDTAGVCLKLLCEGTIELANEFVHWCCNSSQMKIKKFKNELMLSDNIKYLFTQHRYDEQTIEKVIKWLNPSTEIFIQFRKKFEEFQWLEDCEIAAHFIRNQKWNEVDQFIQLAFESYHDRRRFKEELAQSKIRDEILESIAANNNEGVFIELENFLKLCASGNTAKVSALKDTYGNYFKEKFSHKLIIEDKYQLLEKFFNWLFPNDECSTARVKCFYAYRTHSVQLVFDLVAKNDRLRSLKKFVLWCFTKSKEIATFKKWILELYEDSNSVCIKLLSKGLFELANEFVHWCCDSSQTDINKFKNELIFHDGTKHFFTGYERDDEMLKRFTKWFNPSY